MIEEALKALKELDNRIEALRAERQELSDMSQKITEIVKVLRTEHLTSLSMSWHGLLFVNARYKRNAKQMAPLLEELSTKFPEFNIADCTTIVKEHYVQFNCRSSDYSMYVLLFAEDMESCVFVPRGKKTIQEYVTVEVDDYAVLCPEEAVSQEAAV